MSQSVYIGVERIDAILQGGGMDDGHLALEVSGPDDSRHHLLRNRRPAQTVWASIVYDDLDKVQILGDPGIDKFLILLGLVDRRDRRSELGEVATRRDQ